MVIWVLFAVLTAAVVFMVLRPTLRNDAHAGHVADEADLAVYQAQLNELDADVERGVIGADEANAARIEVSRKILQLAEHENASGNVSRNNSDPKLESALPSSPHRATILLAAVIPLCAGVFYANMGSPHLPDLPHAPRLKQDLKTATAGNLLARVEAHLRENPTDGKGWEVLAPFYLRAGRADQAADAYRKTIQLLGETPDRLIGYVNASLQANNGVVTEEARKISQRLRKLVPDRAEPKFWLGLAHEQDGNFEGARAAYQALLATATDKSPWKDMVQGRLDGLAKADKP